jgi:heat shock protein HslJ
MQQRQQVVVIALVALAVVVGVLVLFAFLNRGQDSGALTGRTWQLATITGQTPAYQGVVPAEDQPRYTIAFGADGTFAARADCNTLAGTYQLSGSDGITITPGPSTLVACPDGSYGSLFAHALGMVTTWAIADDELTLTASDGGTARS